MTHWGWYWKHKQKHKPKALCSWSQFQKIDSFDMFKNQELVKIAHESHDKLSLHIPQYNLKAFLQPNNSLKIQFNNGRSYIIPVEKKSCNYGGFYYFFHCPLCSKRMRKLYCLDGQYQCRKCAKLGYASQRHRPATRNLLNTLKIKDALKNTGGSLDSKPPRMHHSTFQKTRIEYVKHDELYFYNTNKELRSWYGRKVEMLLEDYYFPLESSLCDAIIER